MRIIKTVKAMQGEASKWKRRGIQVGVVPTMGYLHAGHESLIARARRLVGKKGMVVVTVYVNPTQFGPQEDLARYPRDLLSDQKLCRAAGADVMFVPADSDIYP